MHTRMCTDPTTCQTRQDTRLQPNEWTSVQAVEVCNATAPRLCTLVLFLAMVMLLALSILTSDGKMEPHPKLYP